MTQTVMRQAEGGSEARPPIVVAIGAQNSQTYLNNGNEMLLTLYGYAPVRVDLPYASQDPWKAGGHEDIGEHYIYPEAEGAKHAMLDDHPEMSTNELNRLLKEGTWLYQEIIGRMRDKIIAKLPERYSGWEQDVRIFIISERALLDGSQLLTAINSFGTFPNAKCFGESHQRGTVPELIQYGPRCMNCGKEMRPAGNAAFVCESCGATSGGIGTPSEQADGVLCPQCSRPMSLIPSFKDYHYCNHCGYREE